MPFTTCCVRIRNAHWFIFSERHGRIFANKTEAVIFAPDDWERNVQAYSNCQCYHVREQLPAGGSEESGRITVGSKRSAQECRKD